MSYETLPSSALPDALVPIWPEDNGQIINGQIHIRNIKLCLKNAFDDFETWDTATKDDFLNGRPKVVNDADTLQGLTRAELLEASRVVGRLRPENMPIASFVSTGGIQLTNTIDDNETMGATPKALKSLKDSIVGGETTSGLVLWQDIPISNTTVISHPDIMMTDFNAGHDIEYVFMLQYNKQYYEYCIMLFNFGDDAAKTYRCPRDTGYAEFFELKIQNTTPGPGQNTLRMLASGAVLVAAKWRRAEYLV